MATPIYVISGFLGAGKTTLINRLLHTAPADARIMVLVNEFGKISIDRKVIRAEPANVVDLSGGCVCCGLFLELVASIRFALETVHADGIWIESTGLAIPQEIFRQALSPAFEGRVGFGAILTVVEPADVHSAEPTLLREQLKEANVVVLNKVDTVAVGERAPLLAEVRALAPSGCVLFETSYGRLRYGDVFGRTYDGTSVISRYSGARAETLDSTAGYRAISLVQHGRVRRSELAERFRTQGRSIVRSKGLVLTDEGASLVQFSRTGFECTPVECPVPWSELVLIVREEAAADVESAFLGLFERKIE